jgi:cobalt-zinc-cadmium efflux system membrane fusion protein
MAGCGGQKEPTAEAVSPKPEPKKESASHVELDQAARRQARIGVEPVVERSLPESIRASGRIALNENRTWRVGSVADGRLVKVAVNVGDAVKQGQVLARLHSHDVHESRAAYQKATSELARLNAQEAQARRARDRAKTLLGLKAASVEQVEHAEAELRNVEEAIRQVGFELARTKAHLVDFLEVPLEDADHTSGHDDDLIPSKSPADGVVWERHVTVGSAVQPGGAMFTIADPSTLWMIALVDEEHFGKLRMGMLVQVSVQAHPGRTFTGRLVKLGEQLDAATRTIQARIELPNAAGLLKPEMYADAELQASGARSALMVAEAAIQDVKGQSVVFVERSEGRFEPVAVKTGRTRGGMVEIEQGLAAGDRVVVRGAFAVKSQLLRKSLEEE